MIDAEPGQKLRVVLKPVGKIKALGHNFVLLKPRTEAKPFVDKAAARSACSSLGTAGPLFGEALPS